MVCHGSILHGRILRAWPFLYVRACRCLVQIIMIIIAPLTIVKEDQLGDLECLQKACQAAITDGGLFTNTGVDERCENERHGENASEMKTVSRFKGPENRQELVRSSVLSKEECFSIIDYIEN